MARTISRPGGWSALEGEEGAGRRGRRRFGFRRSEGDELRFDDRAKLPVDGDLEVGRGEVGDREPLGVDHPGVDLDQVDAAPEVGLLRRGLRCERRARGEAGEAGEGGEAGEDHACRDDSRQSPDARGRGSHALRELLAPPNPSQAPRSAPAPTAPGARAAALHCVAFCGASS